MIGDQEQLRLVALDLLRPIIGERTVFLTGSVARSRALHEFMTDCGAQTISVPLKSEDHGIQGRLGTYERLLTQTNQELQTMVSEIDIAGTGLFYAGSFSGAREVCGRRVIGARRPEHLAAERKDLQRQILKLEGTVVSLLERLPNIQMPTVIQGVPRSGVTMASSHTYLVPQSPNMLHLEKIIQDLRRDCDKAILSSFNYGTPCTFYGFVTETAIVDFGPVEALVYWDPASWRLHTPGIIRPLDINEAVLANCRSSIHRLARALNEKFGYLGAFGVDGVVSDCGYVMHEINPRVCAGFALLDQLAPKASPLAAVDLILREVPSGSHTLSEPLLRLSESIVRNTAADYRLWEVPHKMPQGPTGRHAQTLWKHEVRRSASAGLLSTVELKGRFS